MTKKGSMFVADPHRGLRGREDLDRLCHAEVQEEVNSFLLRQSTHDPDNHTELKLVAVNPDGERRSENSYLCFWHPEVVALRLKNKLFHPEMGSDEDREAAKFHEHYGWLKDFRTIARGKVRLQAAHHELIEENEDEGEDERSETQRQQEEWEHRTMEDGC